MDQSIVASAGSGFRLLAAAGLTLDPETHEVRRDGQKLHLELREFQLLEYLLRNKNRIVPRGEILREIWRKDILNHTLDARISALRKKIEYNFPVKILYTISRKGYFLFDHSITHENENQ
jgi:two-component system, OmpR family, copper resistance phosphate regulon response regulator CusR